MTAQTIAPDGAAPALRGDEFHPIRLRLVSDVTEVTCEQCGPLEHTGAGLEGQVAHGADHAIATGHAVTERHVRVTELRPEEQG